MADYSDTGVFNVDGQWATSINYEIKVVPDGVTSVDLQFKNGRANVAKTQLTLEQAREVLGQDNFSTIEKELKERGENTGVGQLRGRHLRFRQVTLPDFEHKTAENTIALDSRTARKEEIAESKDKPPSRAIESNDPEVTSKRKMQSVMVPAAVEQKFIHVGDNYYFRDQTLAFVDKGTKLKAESQNVEVVRSLVAIAEAREWQSITVTGTEQFRRDVWRDAAARGISVRGYTPTEIERQQLENKKSATNERASNNTADRQPIPAGATIGKLVAAGAAPYQFKEGNTPSFQATIETEQGNTTLWGADLKRALNQSKSQAKIGDMVVIQSTGSQPVTVKVPDQQGVFQPEVRAKKSWSIEKADYLKEQAGKAEAIRTSSPETAAAVANEHPSLSSALAAVYLQAQFARNKGMSQADSERMATMVKERFAASIERGEDINLKRLERELALANPRAAAAAKHPELAIEAPEKNSRESAHAR
ncbi:LPD7 domain-containing protein [Denitromonas iodatirespirans]|uniref:Large polyvalent protein-associated domain-containing protein n=1 Tax=Denitromonas iodatirespirans TaxID=2795389 RepID=A0A944DDE7_DENI1|nr:LPD7 domain-containing protein [Denitromonas iodatirespirans]MBT0963016.1 hypothetical protein [Denitromonas iodatirespirans]